jgi:hypothetical protein
MTALEHQARLLFLAAQEQKPEQWRALLDQACGDNAELRARIEQLVAGHQAMGSIPVGGADPPAADVGELIPERPGAPRTAAPSG